MSVDENDYRLNPRTNTRNPIDVTETGRIVEYHEDLGAYGIKLKNAIQKTSPSSTVVTKVVGSVVFTEKTDRLSGPGATEFWTDYKEAGYAGSGFIEFNSIQEGIEFDIDYKSLGRMRRNKDFSDMETSLTNIENSLTGIGNLISESDYTIYKNADADTPGSGTGGSPSITWTESAGVWTLTKDAASRRGEGISFLLPNFIPVFQGVKLRMKIDCQDADFNAGDIRIFFGNGISNQLIGNVKKSYVADSTAYATYFEFEGFNTSAIAITRVFIHIATTNANAYDLSFSEFSLETVKIPLPRLTFSSDAPGAPAGVSLTITAHFPTGDVTFVKDFSSAWEREAGAYEGGLAAGASFPTSGEFFIQAIQINGGQIDFVGSNSASVTIPDGWEKIGPEHVFIALVSGTVFRTFTHDSLSKSVLLSDSLSLDLSVSDQGTTRTTRTAVNAPRNVLAFYRSTTRHDSGSYNATISPAALVDQAPSLSAAALATTWNSGSTGDAPNVEVALMPLNSSRQYTTDSTNSSTYIRVQFYGWIWPHC